MVGLFRGWFVADSSTSSSAFPARSVGFTILLLLLRSQLYLWGSPFCFFFCVPSYICGVHHSTSSSTFPAISLGSPFYFFFYVPSYIFGFTILLLLLRSQLYLWVHHFTSSSTFPAISLGSPFYFFFYVPSYIFGFTILLLLLRSLLYFLGFTILGDSFAYVTVFLIQPLR